MVDEDSGDRLGPSFAGAGVGGKDLLARFQAGDGDGSPAGKQHFGAWGEAHPAAGRSGVSDCGVFCGAADGKVEKVADGERTEEDSEGAKGALPDFLGGGSGGAAFAGAGSVFEQERVAARTVYAAGLGGGVMGGDGVDVWYGAVAGAVGLFAALARAAAGEAGTAREPGFAP